MDRKASPFPEISVTADQLAAAIRLAILLISQGRYQQSEKLLEGLTMIDPENPYIHALLASSCQHQNKNDEAIFHYTEAIRLYPDDINSLTNRGELYLRAGKLRDAAADLAKAIEIDSSGSHPSAARARLLSSMAASAIELVHKKGIGALD